MMVAATIRSTLLRAVSCAVLIALISAFMVGCGRDMVNATKLEQAIENSLRHAEENYQATCPKEIPWEPPDRSFLCVVIDKDGERHTIPVRIFGEGSRELYGVPGLVADFNSVPQTKKPGFNTTIGEALYRKSNLE